MWLSEILDRSKQSIKLHYIEWFIVALIITLLALPLSVDADSQAIASGSFPLSGPQQLAILILIGLALQVMITPGIIAMGMAGATKRKVNTSLISTKMYLAPRYFGFSLLYATAIIFGLLALVIPGIYLALRFSLTPYIMIDDGKIGVFDAMKRSGDLMKGKYLKVLGSFVFIGLMAMLVIIFGEKLIGILTGTAEESSVFAKLSASALRVLPTSIYIPIFYVGVATVYFNVISAKNGKVTKKNEAK